MKDNAPSLLSSLLKDTKAEMTHTSKLRHRGETKREIAHRFLIDPSIRGNSELTTSPLATPRRC